MFEYLLEHLGNGFVPRLVKDEAAVERRHAICKCHIIRGHINREALFQITK